MYSLKVQDGSPIENGISGTALVLRGDAGFSNLHNWTGSSQLRVRVPGRDEFNVAHNSWIPREKHPVPGFELPVTVNRDDPTDLRIEWDQAPTMEERIARRDPAILDPEGTWARIAPMVSVHAGPDPEQIAAAQGMAAPFLPASSVLLQDLRDAAERQDPTHLDPSPWDGAQIPDWPPAPDQLPKGRLVGTALAVSISADPFGYMFGDNFRPPWTHFASRGGSVSASKYEYLGWLLLCVVPPNGVRYGLYLRTHIHSRRVGPMLPVTLNPQDPSDIEILWDNCPNLSDLAVEKFGQATEKVQARVADALTLQQNSVTSAINDVQDPVLKAQVEQMWSKLGVDTSAGTPAAPAPPAASPDVAGDLERLQKLRDSGILTEDEFTAQRAKILNSI
jgi:hypothetical protein